MAVVFLAAVPPASAAIIDVMDAVPCVLFARLLFDASDSVWLDVPGVQLRNAVQILHGFPSGPITIPGGTAFFFLSSWLVSLAAMPTGDKGGLELSS